MQVVGVRLVEKIFIPIDPGSSGESGLPLELYVFFFAAVTIVGAFGWAYMARGLVQARRFANVGRTGALAIVVVAAAVIPTAVLVGTGDFTFGGRSTGLLLMVFVVISLVATFVEKLAIGYMAVTATRGWLAAEAPRIAWGLAGAGAWLLLLASLAFSMLPIVGSWLIEAVDPEWVFRGISLAFTASGVALLMAFTLGLPDTNDITWYDLADLDAAADGSIGQARDPFDDDDVSDEAELFELSNRRLER